MIATRTIKRGLIPALGALCACAALALLPTTTHQAAAATHPAVATGTHSTVRFGGQHIGSIAKATPAAARKGFNFNGGNWSGAAKTGSGFTSVKSSWTEPSVTCNSTNDLMAPWVGIDGDGSVSIEQTGVATDCSSGHPVYQAWYQWYPSPPVYYSLSSYPVSAGDHFNATVSRTTGPPARSAGPAAASAFYTLTLNNSTRGWTTTINKTGNYANASAEVIIESPTAAYPRFGTVNFTNSTINGSNLGNWNPTLMDASNSGGYEDYTSAVSGGSFSITYLRE